MEEILPPLETVRPTKKQQELLEFIRNFIIAHGYGPSYREIMTGCNYTSVATVAVHVKNLISRGHIVKNGRSARSLQIVGMPETAAGKLQTNEVKPNEEKWLIEKIGYIFDGLEAGSTVTGPQLEDLQTLINALKILGLEGASLSFSTRLSELKKRIVSV